MIESTCIRDTYIVPLIPLSHSAVDYMSTIQWVQLMGNASYRIG